MDNASGYAVRTYVVRCRYLGCDFPLCCHYQNGHPISVDCLSYLCKRPERCDCYQRYIHMPICDDK